MRVAKKSWARQGKGFAALVSALALAHAAAGQEAAMIGTFKPASGATSPYVLNDPANWEERAVPSGPGSAAYLTTTDTASYKFTADFPTSEEGAHVFGSIYGHPSDGNCNYSQSVSGTKLKFDAGEGGWSIVDGYQHFSFSNYSFLSPLWVKSFRLDFDGDYIAGTGIENGVKLSRTQLKYGNKTIGGILGPVSGKGMIYRAWARATNESRPQAYFAGDYSAAGNVMWVLDYASIAIAPGESVFEADATGAAGLPENGLVAQFDPNELVTFRTGRHLASWQSRVAENEITAVPLAGSVTPMLRENEIGPAAMVDLQGWNPRYASGLAFDAPVENARTVVALVDTANGGTNFLAAADASTAYVDGAEIRLNGRALRSDLGETWNDYGLSIVSFRRPEGEPMAPSIHGFGFKHVGAAAGEQRGGMMLGEVLIWNRRLSEEEVAAAEKYLYRKYLKGRTALRNITALAEVTLNVEAFADKASVDNFTGQGEIRKDGAGTLRISKPRANLLPVRIGGGTVEIEDLPAGNFEGADPNATFPTDGLVFHVDATKANTIDRDGRNIVSEWRDAEGRTDTEAVPYRAFASDREGCHPPIYRPDGFNGKPLIDFGPTTRLGTLQFSHELTVRTAVYVGSHQGGGRVLFGKYGAGNDLNDVGEFDVQRVLYDDLKIHYVNSRAKWDVARIWADGRERKAATRRGAKNNNSVDILDPTYSGDMQVMAVQAAYPNGAGFAADMFCYGPRINNMLWDKCGGLKLGEALFYDRVLTEDELAAAQAYLHNKWMKNDTRPHLPTVDVVKDGAIASEADVKVGVIRGSGKLTKKGAGVLEVENLSPGFNGKFASAGGAVCLPVYMKTSPAQLPGPQPQLWLDSSAEGTVVTNESGKVTAWTSREEAAEQITAAPTTAAMATFKLDTATYDGLKWNKHAVFTSYNIVADSGNSTLYFDRELGGLQTIVMVYRHDGGEYGRVMNSSDGAWNRGRWPVVWSTGSTAPALRYSRIWVDGGEQPASAKILNGYHIVTINPLSPVKIGSFGACHTYAEVLAYDRELTTEERKAVEAYLAAKWWGKPLNGYAPAGWSEANCHVASGELTDDVTYFQREGTENTVGDLTGSAALGKAGPGTMTLKGDTTAFAGALSVQGGELAYSDRAAGATGSSGMLTVADGAKFNLNGVVHTVAGLEAQPGSVTGGTLQLAADSVIRFGESGALAADSFALLGGGTLEPAFAPLRSGKYPVVQTADFSGAQHLSAWSRTIVEGDKKWKLTLSRDNTGLISVNVRGAGFIIFIQ